jgi:hypothetical protein
MRGSMHAIEKRKRTNPGKVIHRVSGMITEEFDDDAVVDYLRHIKSNLGRERFDRLNREADLMMGVGRCA